MLHILNVLTLSVLLSLTGLATAVAKGKPSPTGMVELCTGSGPVMIYTDEDGNPTHPPHYCPDYTPTLISALDLPPNDLSRTGHAETLLQVRAPDQVTASRPVRAPTARGPPVFV